jgi:hypothetical protein
MPATLRSDEGQLAVRLTRGPEGLWNALVRADPEHQGLPTTRIGLDPPLESMFAYDPEAATPLDPPPAERH